MQQFILKDKVKIKYIGSYLSETMMIEKSSDAIITDNQEENKRLIINRIAREVRRIVEQDVLQSHEIEQNEEFFYMGIMEGQPILLQPILPGSDKANNQNYVSKQVNIDLNPVIDQSIQFIGQQGYTAFYSILIDISEIDSQQLFDDEIHEQPQSYTNKQDQVVKPIVDLKGNHKYIDQYYQDVSVQYLGHQVQQKNKLMSDNNRTESFIMKKLKTMGNYQLVKRDYQKFLNKSIDEIIQNLGDENLAYFSIKYDIEQTQLKLYYLIGKQYERIYLNYKKNKLAQEDERYTIDTPIQISGCDGLFQYLSDENNTALYELKRQDGYNRIRFIDDFENSTNNIGVNLGQSNVVVKIDVKSDQFQENMLIGYLIALQYMFNHKKEEAYFVITDGTCTLVENQGMINEKKLKNIKVRKDKKVKTMNQNSVNEYHMIDQITFQFPFSQGQEIVDGTEKYNQGVYKIKIKLEDEKLEQEVKYQIQLIMQAIQSNPLNQVELSDQSIVSNNINEIAQQIKKVRKHICFKYLRENNLEMFKDMIQNKNFKSSTINKQKGKSLLKSCLDKQKIEFADECIYQIAEKHWKHRLTYEDCMYLLRDINYDNQMKIKALSSIFLKSRVKISSFNTAKVNIEEYSQNKQRDSNSYIYSRGIINIYYHFITKLLFKFRVQSGIRRSLIQTTRKFFEKYLIREPINAKNAQINNYKELVWLDDTDKFSYLENQLKHLPNVHANCQSSVYKDKEEIQLFEQKIDYITSSFKVPEYPYHIESIQFLKQCYMVQENAYLSTDISKIINYRWYQSWYFILVNNLQYVLLSVLMVTELIFQKDKPNDSYSTSRSFGVLSLIVVIVLLFKEFVIILNYYIKYVNKKFKMNNIQFNELSILNKMYQVIKFMIGFSIYYFYYYMSDFDYLLDFIGHYGYLAYFIQDNHLVVVEHHSYHIVSLVATLIRSCFLVFRLFSGVRYLVYMIKKVIKDMIPFTFIFGAILFVFAAVFLKLSEFDTGFQNDSLDNQTIDASYLSAALKGSVDVLLTGGGVDQSTIHGWILCLIGFIAIEVIMLNLIIAIISSTYENIDGTEIDRKAAAHKSQVKLMIDSLNIMNIFYDLSIKFALLRKITGWKSNQRYVYINCCKYQFDDSVEQTVEERIEGIEKQLTECNYYSFTLLVSEGMNILLAKQNVEQ